jgi:hypothetical protein
MSRSNQDNLRKESVKKHSQHPSDIKKNLDGDLVQVLKGREIGLVKNYPGRICRACLGLVGEIFFAVPIHIPENIDQLGTEMVEKEVKDRIQPAFCTIHENIQLREDIASARAPLTGSA